MLNWSRRLEKKGTMMNKHRFLGFIGLGLLMGLAFFFASSLPNQEVALAGGDEGERSITVTGYAEQVVAPNIAYLDLGVRTQGKDLKAAQEDNASNMEAVIKVVKEMGVADEDIKTSNFYVAPQYDAETFTQIIGYEVTHSVQVTLRDIDQTGAILDAAISQGANQAGQVSFDIDETSKDELYHQALTGAIAQGQGKAQAIADTIGVTISKPTRIYEGAGATSYSTPMGGRGGAMVDSAAAKSNFEPGDMSVGATVTLVYTMN